MFEKSYPLITCVKLVNHIVVKECW